MMFKAAAIVAFLCILNTLVADVIVSTISSKLVHCKHGIFLLSDFDNDISKNMRLYGEWEEEEFQMFLSFLKPGDIVIDAGANIGALTVPLAKKVGPAGKVHSFEPQKVINQRLNANIALNDLENVDVYLAALGNATGFIGVPMINYNVESNFGAVSLTEPIENQTEEWTYRVPVLKLDDIDYYNPNTGENCPKLLKMDVERMETWVLQGAAAMLKRCRPFIHSENNAISSTPGLIATLYDFNYVPFWDLKPAFNVENFNKVTEDSTEGFVNMNIFCVPKERLESEGGNVIMTGYMQVERDRPYLHDYQIFNARRNEYLRQYSFN